MIGNDDRQCLTLTRRARDSHAYPLVCGMRNANKWRQYSLGVRKVRKDEVSREWGGLPRARFQEPKGNEGIGKKCDGK